MANIEEAIRRLKFLYEQHGAEEVARAQAAITASTTDTERASLSLEKAFNNLERRYVPVVRAQQEYKRAQDLANDAMKQNPALQDRANVILQNAQQQYLLAARGVQAYGTAINKGTGEARLARHELINLSRQIQDVGVGIASGQSPFTILVQQGSQIADVFATSRGTLAGFFTQMGAGAARFLGSTAGIASGVATMGAAIGYAAVSYGSGQRDIERALNGIGRASGVTRDQINEIATASSSAFGLSTSEAREAATAFASTGKIYQQNVGAATAMVHNFAVATGTDATEASKTLADALADPAKGVFTLEKQFGALDATMVQYVRTLQSQGRLQEAQAVLLAAAAPSIQKQAESVGALTKAWNLASNMVSNYFDHLGKVARRDFERVTGVDAGGFSKQEQLGRAQERLSGLETGPMQGALAQPAIKAAREEVERLTKAIADASNAARENQLNKLSRDAMEVAVSMMPAIGQLKKLWEDLGVLQRERAIMGGEVSGPEKVGNVRAVQIEQENAALVRQAEVTAQIAFMYPGMTLEGAKQLYNLQQQTVAAQAQGTATQLQAQQHASINMMVAQGTTLQQATAIATAQTALAQAQITAQAQAQIVTLQGQLSVAQARTGAEKIVAQEAARVEQLLAQQVPSAQALKIAALERQIAEEQVAAAIDNQIKGLDQQYQLMKASSPEEAARVKAAQAYQKAIDAGADAMKASEIASKTLRNETEQIAQNEQRAAEAAEQRSNVVQVNSAAIEAENSAINSLIASAQRLAYEWERVAGALVSIDWETMSVVLSTMGNVKLFTDPNTGQKVQFNPEGYQSTITGSSQMANPLMAAFLTGDYSKVEPFDFKQHLTGLFDKTVGDMVVSPDTGTAFDMFAGRGQAAYGGINSTVSGVLGRLINIAPEDQKASLIQREIDLLKQQPATLEREELLKALNEQLKSLTDATGSLEDQMKASLDPLFSQGHDFINSLRIGYYKAAEGGVFGPGGRMRLMPINRYAAGGVANSPQMAMFGEAGPEAFVPLKGGAIPVEIRGGGASNDNSRSVTQNINVTFTGTETPQRRLTARQVAQSFGRGATSAAMRA